MSPPKPPHLTALGDPRAPLAKFLAAGVLIVAVAVGLILYAGPEQGAGTVTPQFAAGGTDASQAGGPPGPASLWVNAGDGATVYVDGEPVGEVPLWVDSLTRGLRRVEIVDRAGATVADTTVSVLPGTVTDLDFTGGLLPTARPPDAFAVADRSPTDQPEAELATPVTRRPETPPAAPRRAARPPPPPDRASPPDRAAATARAAPRPRATGELRVTSSPTGADVRLDGRRLGTTPLTVGRLSPGRYDLVVARLGYETLTQSIVVHPTGVSETTVSLLEAAPAAPRTDPPRTRPDPPPSPRSAPDATGTVEILVKPWGRIVIDGATHQRETDVVYQTVLSVGPHQVTASHPQLGSVTRSVFVAPDGRVRIEIDLTQEGN